MNLLRTLVFSALLALLGAASFAITITENDAIFRGDDPRLDQKATFHADGIRLADALAQLSESTGVTMAAGIDKDDWMVYDRKVVVHVTGMTLRDVMQNISSVMRFHWSRGGDDGKWTYRLWQDKEQRTEEESLRGTAENAQTRGFREKRVNAVADLVNLGSLGQTDAVRLKSSDPWRYILATEPLGRDVAEFINSFPEARNAFVQGTQASFPVSAMAPQIQDTVRRIATSYDSLTKSIGASDDHSELLNRFDKLQITINQPTSGEAAEILSRSLLGRITVGSGVDSFDIPLFDPASPMARALGSAIVGLKSGKSKSEVAKQLQTDVTAVAQAPALAGKASRDISSDPDLSKRVKLFDQSAAVTLPVTLKAVAEKTGYNVISDYFLGAPPSMLAVERTLGEQLEAISTAYGSNWEKAGGTLRFRDTEWFKKRAWEVPMVWLDYWTARGKKNDGMLLQDFVQIGCLRDEQIDHTIMLSPGLLNLGAEYAARNRQILRFYGSLTDDQRKTLSTQQVVVNQLSDEQWAMLQKALAAEGAAYAAATKGSQFIKLTESGSDVVTYSFAYYPGQNETPVTFKLTTGLVLKTREDAGFPEKKK